MDCITLLIGQSNGDPTYKANLYRLCLRDDDFRINEHIKYPFSSANGKYQALLTADEKHVIITADCKGGYRRHAHCGCDQIWIIDIIDDNEYHIRMSKIRFPSMRDLYTTERIVALSGDIDRSIICGFLRSYDDAFPDDLINLISKHCKLESMHCIRHHNNKNEHFVAWLSDILN